ncbi:hypothetical protein SCP_0803270 [Sparassis crispa]|uniref:Uncharacterized protein n=1 Tax=Sparassis crispa TaxID=139825 RepID=A0A401GU92_9APHY|nr:hypothetical protein SCP_0803270 [Sparassis crispa]GBE85805.1 hypothetical protein SCP_0803270 [Sparassis crispa]
MPHPGGEDISPLSKCRPQVANSGCKNTSLYLAGTPQCKTNLVPAVDDYGGLAKVVPDTQDLPELQSDDISPSKPPLHDGIIGRHSILHTSSIMVLLLLLGLASALGHHAFNAHLVGHAVDSDLSFGGWFNVPSQTLVFRVATAFVFLTKTFFTSAVSMAFTQRLWVTVSRKYLRLSGLDALWAVLKYVVIGFCDFSVN